MPEITTAHQDAELRTQPASAQLSATPMSASDVLRHVTLVTEIAKTVMQDGEHYGTIPGTDKPTLFKAGAEKLQMAFRLVPDTRITRTDLDNGHREYEVEITLTARDGTPVATGNGLCSTMESKYRYRGGGRKCPQCGEPAIARSKPQYGGGWYCNQKRGGCGAKFEKGDPKIESVSAGRPENPDIADCYNTVLKMAKKRALVDAVLSATAASDCFAQDIEDLDQHFDEVVEREERRGPPPPPEPQAAVRREAPPQQDARTGPTGQTGEMGPRCPGARGVQGPTDSDSNSDADPEAATAAMLAKCKSVAKRIHGEPGGSDVLKQVKERAGVDAFDNYDTHADKGGDMTKLLNALYDAEAEMGLA
jgi:hypothetical protein